MTSFGLANAEIECNATALLQFCRSQAGNSHDAEDLCQTVILKYAEHRRSHPAPKKVGPYLRQMAANELQSWHRGAARESSAKQWARNKIRTFEPAAGQDLQRQETGNAIDAAIRSLPTAYRAAAKLHYIDEFSSPEVARELAIENENAHRKIQRARKMLQRKLADFDPFK